MEKNIRSIEVNIESSNGFVGSVMTDIYGNFIVPEKAIHRDGWSFTARIGDIGDGHEFEADPTTFPLGKVVINTTQFGRMFRNIRPGWYTNKWYSRYVSHYPGKTTRNKEDGYNVPLKERNTSHWDVIKMVKGQFGDGFVPNYKLFMYNS